MGPIECERTTLELRAGDQRKQGRLRSLIQLPAARQPIVGRSGARLNAERGQLVFDEDQSPKRHALHDVGLAVENLIVTTFSYAEYAMRMVTSDWPAALDDSNQENRQRDEQ